jgi:hypothetical protein
VRRASIRWRRFEMNKTNIDVGAGFSRPRAA